MLDQDVEPDGEVLSSLRQQPSQSEPAGLNGPGLWDNWTRSFTSPVMALLDLFDNSMDATMCGDHKNLKKIHMFGDVHPKDANEETGLCIINSCAHRIPPLKEVMRVFKSLKHTQQIGENGVGIKQACAALSDLSFVLTKNKSEFSLGLISRGLQEEDQNINLPTYRFIRENDSFKNFLDNLIASEEELEACVVCYGDNDLELGKDRLIRHFRKLVSYPW